MSVWAHQLSKEPFRLQVEADFFDAHRAEWLKEHEGEFALIKGTRLLGFYPTQLEGWEAGLELLGIQDMLVHQVLEKDPVIRVPGLVGTDWQSTEASSRTVQT